jgi:hypothetical protein
MSEQYTKTPWRVGGHPSDKSGSAWREILTDATEFSPSFVCAALENDAQRIVACMNACDGITTERLEDLGLPLMQHLIGCDKRASRMVKERTELLAMIETLCNGLRWNIENQPYAMNQSDEEALAEAEALLARLAA